MSWHGTAVTLHRASPAHAAEVLDVLDEAAAWLRRRGVTQWPEHFESSWIDGAIERGETWLAHLGATAVGTLTLDWSDPLWTDIGGPPDMFTAWPSVDRRRALGRSCSTGRQMPRGTTTSAFCDSTASPPTAGSAAITRREVSSIEAMFSWVALPAGATTMAPVPASAVSNWHSRTTTQRACWMGTARSEDQARRSTSRSQAVDAGRRSSSDGRLHEARTAGVRRWKVPGVRLRQRRHTRWGTCVHQERQHVGAVVGRDANQIGAVGTRCSTAASFAIAGGSVTICRRPGFALIGIASAMVLHEAPRRVGPQQGQHRDDEQHAGAASLGPQGRAQRRRTPPEI